MDDSNIALQCSDENCVRRRDQKHPDRDASEPDATNELVVDTATWHTSAVHLDNSDYQREERRAHVCDALVDDQNVYRLIKQRPEHVSGAWAAKKPLRAPTYFCNLRSPLRSRSVTSRFTLRSAPFHRFSATPGHRSAPLHPIFGPLRSIFRSAHAPLKCSDNDWALHLSIVISVDRVGVATSQEGRRGKGWRCTLRARTQSKFCSFCMLKTLLLHLLCQ